MKLVFDTNVLFAAFATRGLVHSVFEFCLENHAIVISEHILGELERHLGSKLSMPAGEVGQVTSFLREICTVGGESAVDPSACRDKDDLKILGLAEKAGADLIISGDDDLLIAKMYHSIPILSPRQFWERARKHREPTLTDGDRGKPSKVHETMKNQVFKKAPP